MTKSIRSLRKRFCKDCGVPIQIFEDDFSNYFTYFLETYNLGNDEGHTWLHKYNNLLGLIKEKFDNDIERFFSYYHNLSDMIIKHIQEKKEYKKFISENNSKFDVNNMPQSKNIYNENNSGKIYYSFDLIKANFFAFKFFNANIIDNKNSYEDFIKQFTEFSYFIESKYIRQVIFGNCNPKRQQKIQKYFIKNFIDNFIVKNFEYDKVISTSSDEVIVEHDSFDPLILSKIKEYFGTETNPIKTDCFELLKNGKSSKLGFVKTSLITKKNEFKGVSPIYMPQAFKKWLGLEINGKDLTFSYEGELAMFLGVLE